MSENNTVSDEAATTWWQSRNVIKEFLKILRPDMSEADHEHNAAAIIARLSHAGFSIERHGVE